MARGAAVWLIAALLFSFQSSTDLKFHFLKDLTVDRPEEADKPDPVILMRAKGNPGVFVEVS